MRQKLMCTTYMSCCVKIQVLWGILLQRGRGWGMVLCCKDCRAQENVSKEVGRLKNIQQSVTKQANSTSLLIVTQTLMRGLMASCLACLSKLSAVFGNWQQPKCPQVKDNITSWLHAWVLVTGNLLTNVKQLALLCYFIHPCPTIKPYGKRAQPSQPL